MELFENKPTEAYKCCRAVSKSLTKYQICEYDVIVCYISFLNLPLSMPVLYTICKALPLTHVSFNIRDIIFPMFNFFGW